ncbi:MAG TPA: nucleotidyltransferase domain-containing protein [Bdellovibrionota bacterium]|nr:nucleotidyltransferase domain-containing protein [Bdellovibrionota bacterium]
MTTVADLYSQIAQFPLNDLRLICLFGSFARGDAHEGSDIDLFIVTKGNDTPALQTDLQTIAERIGKALGRKVDLVIVEPNLHGLAPDFRSELLADSIVLYGRGLLFPEDDGNSVAYRLIAYETSRLDPLARTRLSRQFFGYSTKVRHGRKTYRYHREGAVARSGGFRVDLSVFLCPADRSGEIFRILRESKAGYTDRLVYLERFEDAPLSIAAR